MNVAVVLTFCQAVVRGLQGPLTCRDMPFCDDRDGDTVDCEDRVGDVVDVWRLRDRRRGSFGILRLAPDVEMYVLGQFQVSDYKNSW
jgi:hypothetical protein